MLECFEKSLGHNPEFRKERTNDFDYREITTHLKSEVKQVCGDDFNRWGTEVVPYRNMLHRTAHAIRYLRDVDVAFILKSNFIKDSTGWVQTLGRPNKDFVPAEEIMQRHWELLLKWIKPVWDYFIKHVNDWRVDQQKFREMLNLPIE